MSQLFLFIYCFFRWLAFVKSRVERKSQSPSCGFSKDSQRKQRWHPLWCHRLYGEKKNHDALGRPNREECCRQDCKICKTSAKTNPPYLKDDIWWKHSGIRSLCNKNLRAVTLQGKKEYVINECHLVLSIMKKTQCAAIHFLCIQKTRLMQIHDFILGY